jgi:hypothetical protein
MWYLIVIISIFYRFAVNCLTREEAMAVSIAQPRPDLAAHREALSLAWPELVTRLTEIIGRKLTAYIAGVKDVRALDRWINGTEPYRDVEDRLRFAYQVVRTLSQHDSPKVVQAWLTGVNPELGDRVPLRVLRDGEVATIAPEILGAARAFIAGA